MSGARRRRRGGGYAPAVINYTDNKNVSSASNPQNFASVNVGGLSHVVIGVYSKGSGLASGVTVGGNSFAPLVSLGVNSNTSEVSLWIGDNPGGTPTVAVSGLSGGTGVAIIAWEATVQSTTAVDTGTSSASPATTTLTIPADGIGVGMASPGNADGTSTWSGLLEDVDAVFAHESTRHYSAGSLESAAGGDISVSVSYSATSSTNRAAVFASLR